MSPRDYAFLGYIVFWVAMAVWVNRWPVPWGLTPIGIILALFAGAALGWILPHEIPTYVPDGYGYSNGPPRLSGFGRLAQIVGLCAGAYVALRGALIWMLVLSAGVLFGILLNIAALLFS